MTIKIDNYSSVSNKGPLRLFIKTDYTCLTTCACPNNIHVLITKTKNFTFLKKKGIVKKNEVFINLDGQDFFLPFKFKFIEVTYGMPYIAIILRI